MSYKGDVKFDVEGQPHTLVFTVDALIELEEIFERNVQEIGAMFSAGLRMKDLRTVFHIGLGEHHPEADEGAASWIMSQIGITRAGELVGEAFLAAFGGVDAIKEAGQDAPARPRKRAGTGRRASTSGSTISSAASATSDG